MVTNTDVANLFLQNKVVFPQKLFDSDASKDLSVKLTMHSPPRHQSSHILWEPTPTLKINGVNFGTHIFLGPWGLATFGTQTYLQNWKNLVYQSKILQDGICGRNVYMCTL